MQSVPLSDQTVLFIETVNCDLDGMRGGALLTDVQTEPLEFRLTDVVTPNRLQKTLWGSRLRGHLTVEIIGKPLFAAFTRSPSLIIVQQFELLELRPFTGVPQVLLIRGEHDRQLPAYVGNRQPLDEDSADSILIAVHRQFEGDIDIAEPLIRHLAQFCAIQDPFDRVSTGLRLIEEQESRGRSSQQGDVSRRNA